MGTNNDPDRVEAVWKPLVWKLIQMASSGGAAGAAARRAREVLGNRRAHPDGFRLLRAFSGRQEIRTFQVDADHDIAAIDVARVRLWCFVGTSADVDIWCAKHADDELVVFDDGRVHLARLDRRWEVPDGEVLAEPHLAALDHPIFDAIAPALLEALRLHGTAADVVARATFRNWADARERLHVAEDVADGLRALLRVVGDHLVAGDVLAGDAALAVHLGEAQRAHAGAAHLEEAVRGAQAGESIVDLSVLSPDVLEPYLDPQRFREWLLFLHPDQWKLVRAVLRGPGRITGVSGSGKTVVLVHRARELALRYPGQRVLVATLNAALATLLSSLVDAVCTGDERRRIDVRPVYAVCHSIAQRFDRAPERLRLVDPSSGEHVEGNSWNDFFAHPMHAREHRELIGYLARKVIPRQTGDETWYGAQHVLIEWEEAAARGKSTSFFGNRQLDRKHGEKPVRRARVLLNAASRYLRDELLWIRSAYGNTMRDAYVFAERSGRCVPIDQPRRRAMLVVLAAWEEYMKTGGLLDPAGVSLLAQECLDSLHSAPELRYRCVLADEAQDLSTLELKVLRSLVDPGDDDILLVGDAAQQVYSKQSSARGAGIVVAGARGKILRRNFRNTREVLVAGDALIRRFAPPGAGEDEGFARLDPQFSSRRGPKPAVVTVRDAEAQLKWVVEHMTSTWRRFEGAPLGVVSARKATRVALVESISKAGLTARELDERGPAGSVVYVSDFERVKGLEFAGVVICDITRGKFPALGVPEDEWWREACHLYVAMTRAREEVCIVSVGQPSLFIEAFGASVRHARG